MATLEGKVALITGGARGIGKSIALRLAGEGAAIMLGDVLIEDAEKTAGEINDAGGQAAFVNLNVTDAENCKEAVKHTVEEFGRIDQLVNNAGITRDNLLMRMKKDEWDSVMAVNLTGVFNCTQAVVRYMMKQRYGRIVNIASVIGQAGNPGQSNYGATKAGVIGFTKSAAREVASRGITVNAITPGFIETAMTEKLDDSVRDAMLATIPLGTLGQPEDIAHAVRFLVSDEASYITGAVLNVNGGMYM